MLIAFTLVWLWIAGKLKRKGWHWLIRQLIAAPLAFLVAICVFGVFKDLGNVIILGLFGGGIVFLIVRHWRGPGQENAVSLAAAEVATVDSPPMVSNIDGQAIVHKPVEPAQLKTPIKDPLAKWKGAAPNSKPTYSSSESSGKSRLGPRIGMVADIEFDYRDARGNDSHRHVNVEAVDREYLQGYCHKANDTRTFVIGRVRGKVLDRENGELLAPKTWAVEARKHPLNDPSLISLGNDDEDDDKEITVDDAGRVEICFTGFSKADRLRLEELAELLDMQVRQSVTRGLTHLCIGRNAGPKKMEQAAEVGAEIIDEADFYVLNTSS